MYVNSLKTAPLEEWVPSIWDEDYPDTLHMVSHDRAWENLSGNSPWTALNRPADPNRKNNSLVAFVVEGEEVENNQVKIKKTLPKGVFAIESPHVDAFSDEDVEGLRDVFTGLSSLIRQTTHKNSSLDYRLSMAEAFKDYPVSEHGWGNSDNAKLARRLIFVVQKIDGKELEKLCQLISESLKNFTAEEKENVLKDYEITLDTFEKILEIQKVCPGISDKDVDDKKASQSCLTSEWKI